MLTPNPIMLKAGFRPAAEVATFIGKAHSTVHRMVTRGDVEGTRDGRALYVRVASLVAYYESTDNAAMAAAVKEKFACG